jgi:replicative superfamily II helicase
MYRIFSGIHSLHNPIADTRVNRMAGLFYFGEAFRPVPLEKHFIGVRGKAGSTTSNTNLDRATYDKVTKLVREGHQVMVFVHARRGTVTTARKLHELAMSDGVADIFDCSDERGWEQSRMEVGRSKNKEIREFFDYGFAVHHAGMLRSDRNLAERLFADGHIKVLCCTATLAWGVNLPAYAVIIKGTELYDQSKGKFVDLGVLDVLQVISPWRWS